MWDRAWAEANGGNVSLRLNSEQNSLVEHMKNLTEWIPLPLEVPSLGSEKFIFTGTGRYLRNVELAPERNIGLIELNKNGSAYRIYGNLNPMVVRLPN